MPRSCCTRRAPSTTATVGQLLEVDQYDAASLQRHALGACRFKGVPDLVRVTYDEVVARVLADGLPAPVQTSGPANALLVGAILAALLLAGVVVVSWRVMRERSGSFTAGDPSVTHYVVARRRPPAWTRDSVDVSRSTTARRPTGLRPHRPTTACRPPGSSRSPS